MRSVIGENIFSTHCDLASDLGTLMPAIKSATRSTRSILRATKLISNHIGSSQLQEKVCNITDEKDTYVESVLLLLQT